MTQNQVAYWNLQENRRSNLAREAETHENNVGTRRENQRANMAREAETSTHNRATEKLQREKNTADAVIGGVSATGQLLKGAAPLLLAF